MFWFNTSNNWQSILLDSIKWFDIFNQNILLNVSGACMQRQMRAYSAFVPILDCSANFKNLFKIW